MNASAPLMARTQKQEFRSNKGLGSPQTRNSGYVSADDTGARHAGKNGFCTQIGHDWFTWVGTRSSKSRLNFLALRRAGQIDYGLNDAPYSSMRQHSLPASLSGRRRGEPQSCFADE